MAVGVGLEGSGDGGREGEGAKRPSRKLHVGLASLFCSGAHAYQYSEPLNCAPAESSLWRENERPPPKDPLSHTLRCQETARVQQPERVPLHLVLEHLIDLLAPFLAELEDLLEVLEIQLVFHLQQCHSLLLGINGHVD